MKYSASILAFAAGAMASYGSYPVNGTVTYTTDVLTVLTTYCPEATVITHGGKTYSASASQTLTITDYKYTVSKPVHSPTTVLYSSCPPSVTASTPTYEVSSPPAETPSSTYSNPLTVVWSTPAAGYSKTAGGPVGTGYPVPSAVPFKGAASSNKVGAMVAGAVAGVVALAL